MNQMQTPKSITETTTSLLTSTSLTLQTLTKLQTLWAGYGHIYHLTTLDPQNQPRSLILKSITPPAPTTPQSESYIRKVISYQVEQYFYTHLAPQLPPDIAVPVCVASTALGDGMAMVLTDLRDGFPVAGEKRAVLSTRQVEAAVDWLAGFHGFWWTSEGLMEMGCRRAPLEEVELGLGAREGVWLNGGYTYLATRRSEYTDLVNDEASEWSKKLCVPVGSDGESIAERVARFLTPSLQNPYVTLIHGDVKSENLFTTTEGDAVAFFDFQYVGLGLGVCDLAKLFTCSLPEEMLYDGARDGRMHSRERDVLRRYLDRLVLVSGRKYPWEVFVRHWEVALVDWLRFQASWGFWGNTEWLEMRVRSILEDRGWWEWLNRNIDVVIGGAE